MEKTIKTKNKRIIYFDILNIIACLSVLFLHMNGIVHQYENIRAWKTALIFEVICYWAVPIFIMLSGATLLNYREKYDTKTFFKKRLSKILIPWIIWSMIIYVINTKSFNILNFVKDFLYCRIEGVYWFFPLILFLYCVIPVLSILTQKEENRNLLKGIVIFIFIFKGIIGPLCSVLDIKIPNIFEPFFEINGYIMLLVLGYLLSTTEIKKNKRVCIYILGIISAITMYSHIYIKSIQEGAINRKLSGYCTAITVLMASAVFLFIKNINWEKIFNKIQLNPKAISIIASCSFGIYLIHVLIMTKLTKALNFNVYSIWYRTLGTIALYLICLAIVYIIKKIPILKKIVP